LSVTRRVLRFSAPEGRLTFRKSLRLTALRFHLNGFTLSHCPSLDLSVDCNGQHSSCLKLALLPYSASNSMAPLFAASFEPASDNHAWFSEVPHPGFGYPLCDVSRSNLDGVFQPPTLMGFTLQSFAPSPRSDCSFEHPFRSGAFLRNLTQDLAPALQRLDPSEKAEPHAPQRVNLGRDPLLSWAFLASQAFSTNTPMLSASLRLAFPSRPFPSDRSK
jgi:hypothetical protein